MLPSLGDPVRQPFQPGSVRVGLVVHVRQRMSGVAVAWIEFERGVSQVGCVVPEALLRSAVGPQSEIPRRLAVHAGEPLDVLPSVRQRIARPCECNRRREHKQCNCVARYAVEMVDQCVGARRVSLLAPRRDRLDMAAVLVAPMSKRRARCREMTGDRVRAAGAVRTFGGNHRQRDVRTGVVRILRDRSSKGGGRTVLDGEQATHTLGVRSLRTNQFRCRRDKTGRPHRTLARIVREQVRGGNRLGTDFGNRSGLPQFTLADRADTHDVRDRAASAVDEVSVCIESYAHAARVQRGDIVGQKTRPERGASKRPPIPRSASSDDHRVPEPMHRSVARCHDQFNAAPA